MRQRLLLPGVLVLGFAAVAAASGPVTYTVTVNTSSIAGTAGSLDFNFNPGPLVTQAASLQVLSFAGSGTLAGSPTLTGDVAGALPATLTFDNGTGFNDYFEGFTFGSTLSFTVSLYGPALSSPDGVSTSGSTFAFSMFSDAAGTIPALTTDTTDGFAFTVNVNLDGTTTATDLSSQTGVGPPVILSPPAISKVFGGASIPLTGTTGLSFTITNSNAGALLTGVGFTDNLPAGLAVETPNGLTGSCGGGTVTAAAGSGTVSLSGATLVSSASCTFSVNVMGAGLGLQNNITSNVTSNEGGNGGTASASITVVPLAPGAPGPTGTPVMSPPILAVFALLLAGLGWILARRTEAL